MKTIQKILLAFESEEKNILPVLKEVSKNFRYVSEGDAKRIAEYFGVPFSKVYELATFYDLIQTEKQPQLMIKVCSGGNCAVNSSFKIVKELENFFHVKEGDKFNPKVRLEFMSCLGRCGEGPVVEINGKVFAGVTVSKLHEILENLG